MELRELVCGELSQVDDVLDGGLIGAPECEHGVHKLPEGERLTILEEQPEEKAGFNRSHSDKPGEARV